MAHALAPTKGLQIPHQELLKEVAKRRLREGNHELLLAGLTPYVYDHEEEVYMNVGYYEQQVSSASS